MEKDVVWGMQVEPAKAAGTCKAKFDANPGQFLK